MRRLLIAILLSAFASVASAQTPAPKGQEYGMPSGAIWGLRRSLANANTAYVITSTQSPGCFAYRTQVVIKGSGAEIACAWGQTDDLAFAGNVDSVNACMVQQSYEYPAGLGNDYPGACFLMADGERVDQTLWPRNPKIGGAIGICSAAMIAPGGATVYPACNNNTDCSDYISGATCDTDLSATDRLRLNQQGCSYLICQSDTASAYIYVGVEQ